MSPQRESNVHRLILVLILLTLSVNVSCSEKDNSLSSSGFGSGEDRLLSDAELHTAADPNAPDEKRTWTAWIEDNHVPIRSITSSYYQDLQFLKPLLAGKRYVQLGENSHGVAQYSMVKTRLVKFLHEELDFDVIAFESGLFECYNGNAKKTELGPVELMTSSINGVWHTEEVSELFEYIKSTVETGDPLILAGFDILMPVDSDITGRPAFFQTVIGAVDPIYARDVYDFDSTFIQQRTSYDDFKTYVGENRIQLHESYDSIMSFIDDHESELAAAFSHNPSQPLFARQMAQSVKRYIDRAYYDYKGDIKRNLEVRDLGMYENADFLLNRAYPDKKIIGWAHNFHVCHDSEQIREATYEVVKSMGSHLVEKYRNDMYTIGLYMYRGQARFYHVNVYDITEAESGSLESIMYRCRRKYCFVDMLNEEQTDGNSWMFQKTVAKYWGMTRQKMILRNQYDGIIFIDTVSPAEYAAFGLDAGKSGSRAAEYNRIMGN